MPERRATLSILGGVRAAPLRRGYDDGALSISLAEKLATAFDELIKERGYATRSEGVRDILPAHLQRRAEKRDTRGMCMSTIIMKRELAERLTSIQQMRKSEYARYSWVRAY